MTTHSENAKIVALVDGGKHGKRRRIANLACKKSAVNTGAATVLAHTRRQQGKMALRRRNRHCPAEVGEIAAEWAKRIFTTEYTEKEKNLVAAAADEKNLQSLAASRWKRQSLFPVKDVHDKPCPKTGCLRPVFRRDLSDWMGIAAIEGRLWPEDRKCRMKDEIPDL